MTTKSTFYIIAYDIASDRRRTKVHKTISGYGKWTQYSLFECFLSEKQYLQLRQKLDKIVASSEDSVRFYALCQSCCARTETVGSPLPQDELLYLL